MAPGSSATPANRRWENDTWVSTSMNETICSLFFRICGGLGLGHELSMIMCDQSSNGNLSLGMCEGMNARDGWLWMDES